jgi:PAS domain S-box-containing protein
LDYKKSELIGKPLKTVYTPEFHGKMKRLFKKWKIEEKIVDEELEIITKNSELRTVLLSASVVKDNDGKVLHSISVQRDITERKRAEKAYRESELQLKTIIESLPFDIFALDKSGKYFLQNTSCKNNWGDVIGIRPEDVSTDKTTLALWLYNNRRAFMGNTINEDVSFPVKGQERHFNNIIVPIQDKEQINGIVGINIDITERKHTEEALRKSEERYRTISELISDFVYAIRVEPDGTNISEWSTETLNRIIGVSHAELVEGGGWKNVIHPDDLPIVIKRQKLLAKGKSFVSEYRVITKTGEVHWVRDYAHPVWDADDGRVIYIYGAAQDITERKEVEDALRKSEERFRSIAENSFDIIFIMNSDRKLTYVSPSVERILGYNPKSIIGNHAKKYLNKLDIPKVKKVRDELMKGKEIEGFELDIMGKNSSIVHFEVNIIPIYTNNELSGFQGIAKDITDRKNAEEEMRKRLMKFNLEEGEVYLVKERTPTLAIEAYKDLLKVGYNGLVISRTTEKDFSKFIENDIEFLWLSEKKTKNSMIPDLKKIETRIERLPNRKIVLIDRLDYLITKHGFKKVLMFVHHLKDLAVIHNYLIIISVDQSTLDLQELRLLEKETAEIESLYESGLPQDLTDILKYIYQQNISGIKPSYTEIGTDQKLSKPTARKRIRQLISGGYLNEYLKGRCRVLDLNERGKKIFFK